MSEEEPKSTNFDLAKYTVSGNTTVKEVAIDGTGDTFEVTVKPMSWAKRNQLIAKALAFDGTGNSTFDTDTYIRNCLKEIIVDAPWGRTTEAFLISIDERLGTALEKLVPSAFNGNAAELNGDEIKKAL
jgi:hypothetical protein